MTTNFERIKNMTIEEMAEFLCVHFNCDECPMFGKCYGLGIQIFKNWLKQECE